MLNLIIFAIGCSTTSSNNNTVDSKQQIEAYPTDTPSVLGFSIGQMQSTDIENQLSQLEIPCPSKKGLTKKALLYDCRANLAIEHLSPRKVRGTWDKLFLVQGEESPLHYISLTRKYSIPNALVEDYDSTQQYIESVLGPPQKSDVIDPSKLDGPIFRAVSLWNTETLKVELSVMKMGTETISLYEKWTHISLNAAVKEREGQNGHMAETTQKYDGSIQVLEPADGVTTIQSVFANREQLKDKPVSVQGTVVKSNTVFGTNWYHIQDGSGAASSENHDLTVTSDDTVNIGDVVIVNGDLTVDKDFGFGYFYTAIIEDASIKIK